MFTKGINSVLVIAMVLVAHWGMAQSNSLEITGKVIEGQGNQPVPFATIMVVNNDDKSVVAGTSTADDGTFSVESNSDNVYIEISFIGYSKQRIRNINPKEGKVNLGTITLTEDSQTLDQVVVRAEKSQTEFKLDKRVFNVGQDLSSTGASALEVLNNVPSVNVNIEGQISLRGSSGVQILINGKPSVLASEGGNALGTITADMLEKIEVITNPSAKYEAEGTSGIINIVIKKEEKKGMNGSVTVNTGIPNNHSVGLSLNRRTEKFNLFSQLGVGHRTFPSENENINRDLLSNTTINSKGDSDKNETFYNLILGTDYHINDYNVLTLSGHFAYEIESENANTNFAESLNGNTVSSRWNREEETEATNPKWQYELQYKKDFENHEDHTLLFSALGNFFGKDQSSNFINAYQEGGFEDELQETATNFKNAEYTFKLDYTKPFLESFTLETGAQYVISDVANDFGVKNYIDEEWVQDMDLTNLFDYNQKVMGVYGTGAYEKDKWGLKLGLRLENTDLSTLLETTNESNNQNYTNLFPSVHTSYKITDAISLQAGYSSRIFRPRLWDLNPFFNIRNNYSIRTGNPDLQPEFTDSYELMSIYIFNKASLNFGVYYRYTTDVVERVSSFENNVNVSKPINVGTNRTTGIEFNGKYTPSDWLTFNGDFNFNYFKREGELEEQIFDFQGDQWSSQVMAKFKLPAQIDFEVTGNYESGYQTVQSEISDQLFADLGLRKKFNKGKAVVNLSVRDIFASRVFESETNQPNFYLYNRRLRGRFIILGFSYGFGKGEAMEFAGQKQF